MDNKRVSLQPKALSQQQYILLLSGLFAQYQQGGLSADDFAQLMHSLVAEDVCGTLWTFTPPTGEWWIVNDRAWEAGTPRGPLLLALSPQAAKLVDEIGSLVRDVQESLPPARPLAPQPAMPVAVPTRAAAPPAPAPPAPPRLFCTACGRQLKPGAAYCSGCGRATG